MKIFHGTTRAKYRKMLNEGVLWGIRPGDATRSTFFAFNQEEAQKWGDFVLSAELDISEEDKGDAWEVEITNAIPIHTVTVVHDPGPSKLFSEGTEKNNG
jgi:hypothetical protein